MPDTSPLPWHVNEKPWFIHAANGVRVAQTRAPIGSTATPAEAYEIASERAALIVKAVNSFSALVEAAESARDYLHYLSREVFGAPNFTDRHGDARISAAVVKKLNAALAKGDPDADRH